MATEKRLIDANAVKKVFDNLRNGTFALEDPKTAGVIAGTVITCGILIDEIPTVDAAEVVHGRWIKNWCNNSFIGHEYAECSICDCHMLDTNQFWNSNYCPNCGAKMDGGNGDG